MNAPLLDRVIDIHAHAGPDSLPRKVDALDLARMASNLGMRGIVFKNHFEPTASLAYAVRKAVPEIAAFGGITLNVSVGGMNPAAVEHMASVTGGWGRFVWMGSFDTENQVRYEGGNRPFVPISHCGELLPETRDVLNVIAKHNLILATGHSAPEEAFMLVREAKAQGVRHIVITHAMMAPIHMSLEQMCDAARLGAYIEFAYNGLTGPHKEFEFPDYVKAIRMIGASHCILVSDLGQTANPLHPDGLVQFFSGLKNEGLSETELDWASKRNPARLLGID